ncbi:MAG: outer membrane protein assembly factor [Gemmatimonadota bacterium]|nr:outer membrane protein assembly factor [Gemmatimonadota bacterium]
MIALAALALFAQTSITVGVGNNKKPDSVAVEQRDARREAVRDSLRKHRADRDSTRRKRREAKIIPVTPALLASAFRDVRAGQLLNKARAARLRQDSTLVGYDASAYERVSVGMGLSKFGRDHLLFRNERASHVLWSRSQGALVEVKGQRSASPMLDGGSGDAEIDFGGLEQVPYFPGRETLWIGSGLAKSDVSDEDMVHPLAKGSEAYYTYATGDSVTFNLPGGAKIELRELLVRPRTPRWNTAVGSLWFDDSSGQLVRAVYRLAVPLDIYAIANEEADTAKKNDNVPRWVKGLVSPVTAQIKAITVEYGLHEGRFWLPRVQSLEGEAQVSFMHVPFKMEQSYKYASVNGTDPFPAYSIAVGDTATDSVSRAARREKRRNECKTGTERVRVERHEAAVMNVIVRVPCDTAALARSAELPGSIYDSGDEMFGNADRDQLIRQALTLGAQAGFGPQPPTIRYGLALTRYNRIEGLSTGIAADQVLGNGYAAHALFRIGMADWSPNGELSLDRSDGRATVGVGVYRRLAAANDWADPLGFRGSFSSLFFGRDEGFYYRTAGAELTMRTDNAFLGDWRLFAEQEFDAKVNTEFSFAHPGGVNGKLTNIDAVNGNVVGLATEHHSTYGLDPHALRFVSDFKLEGAVGGFDYSRGSLQVTASHGLGRLMDGALTFGAGTSGGALPIQKQWFVGGVRTVRGQRAGAEVGDAFWLGSLELGTTSPGIRKVIFGDLGWAGSRKQFSNPGRPLSGVGAGVSFMDGLIRFDVAKGIYPEKKIRANLYVEGRF